MEVETVLFGVRCVIFGMLINSILSGFSFYLFDIQSVERAVITPFLVFVVVLGFYILYHFSLLLQKVRGLDDRFELEVEIEEESREELTIVESDSSDEKL